MTFSKAIRLARRRLIRRRHLIWLVFLKNRKDIQRPQQTALPRNSFLDLPPKIRNQIYGLISPELDSSRSLLVHQHDVHRYLGFTNLLQTCRQVYHELRALANEKRMFTLSAFRQHCNREDCGHYRRRFGNPSHGLKFEMRTVDLDRDGREISDSESVRRSVHGYRTTEWYALKKCIKCEESGFRMLQMSNSQLASIKRLVIPCCACWQTTHNGIDVRGLKSPKFKDYSGLGLSPTEIFIPYCVCHREQGSAAALSFRSYIDSLVEWFPTLQRIVIYHCSNKRAYSASRMTQYQNFAADFTQLHGWRDLEGIPYGGVACALVQRQPPQDEVRLEVYSSQDIDQSSCVFRWARGIPPTQNVQPDPTGLGAHFNPYDTVPDQVTRLQMMFGTYSNPPPFQGNSIGFAYEPEVERFVDLNWLIRRNNV